MGASQYFLQAGNLETVEKLAIDFEAKFKVGTGFQPVRIGWKPTPRSCRSTT
jgi:hypothetical protein